MSIIYNGVAFESVAPVKTDDILISPVKLSPLARGRAIRWGLDFVRMNGGERTVTITFALLIENPVLRRESLMAISQWAKTDAEYILELSEDPMRVLHCVCTEKPEPSMRQWWESKLRITFTCFNNPYWTSKHETSVSCGTAFNVIGDAPPLMQIVRTVSGSAASNQSYSDGTNTMTFSTIPVGDMVIDLNSQTAAVGTSSIMQYYATSGSFIIPKTGTQTITGTGTVKYRERFE